MTSRPSRDVRAARLFTWTAVAILAAAVVMVVLPTSVHVSVPGQASDNFYSCGGVVYPIVEPHEEPGIGACTDANGDMLRRAGAVALVGLAVLLVGLRFRRRALSRGERVFAPAG